MELFQDTQYHVFQVPDRDALAQLTVRFDRFRNQDLSEFWTLVKNHLKYPCRIQGPDGPIPTEEYFPTGKPYQVRKNNLVRVCALLHCCPGNIRLVVSLLPDKYGQVLRIILADGCVSYTRLQALGITDMLVKQGYYSWNRWQRGPLASLLAVQESRKAGLDEFEYRYERDGYLFLPDFLAEPYAQALAPEMTQIALLHRESPEQGLVTVTAEKEFVASFPLIQGIYRQSGIKVSGLKISAALSGKILSKTTIPEVIPTHVREFAKVNIGQYFLPPLVVSLDDKFGKSVEDHVSEAVQTLRNSFPETLCPALLPHIKGFRANVLQDVRQQQWMSVLGGAFKSFPDEWISLRALCDFIHGHAFEPWSVGHIIDAEAFLKMYPFNTLTATAILPDNQGEEIDHEMLRALSLALYGMGAAELAVDVSQEAPDTPCSPIRMVRLTPLGRYAFGFATEYHTETVASQACFSLDEHRLIIQSVSGNNPYESLLMDTATPIGGGKFVMSAESFLKNCSTIKDVDEKVKFFEDYVAHDPPQVWKDFFQTIRQRCKPLQPIKGSFIFLQLDPSNKALSSLILGDPEIRSLIIMAEDYRLLVQKEDYAKLCKLLKKHGYLL